MSFDAHANFGYSTVAAAPFPALTGNTLIVQTGDGALFPAAPFNCTVWPAGVQPLASNAEIVTVTVVAGDVLTITRAQEGTAAVAIAVGYQIANTTSKKVFTDIENAIPVVFVGYLSAGAQSASAGVSFADANGVTFGMNAGTMTASVAGAAQSTQPVAASASNGSFLFSTLGFSNANNVTFGTSAGGIITASIVPGAGVAISAAGGSVSAGTVVFSNSNGVSFGMNGSTVTASKADVVISANNGTFANSIVAFEGDGNITVQTAGGNVVSFHVDLQSTQPVAASASNGSFLFSTLGFSNANGVTFGTSAGSIVTASVGAGASPGSISAGTTSVALGQVVFSNSNNVTFGLNGSTVTASAGGGGGSINFSAGTQSSDLASVVFSNSNNVSFGLSNGTITASATNSNDATYRNFFEYPVYNFSSLIGNGLVVNSLTLQFLDVGQNITFSSIVQLISFTGVAGSSNAATSATIGFTQSYGLYSRSVTDSAATNFSNSSVWTLAWSASQSTSGSATISGSSINLSYWWNTDSTGGTSSTSLSTNSSRLDLPNANRMQQNVFQLGKSIAPGEYVFGQIWASTSAGYASASSLYKISLFQGPVQTNILLAPGPFASSNQSVGQVPLFGVYSVSTTGFPASLAASDFQYTSMRARVFFTK